MSADNGIYILHCKDGYRVAHCQAIDNIYYNCRRKIDPEFNARELYFYFKDCKVFKIRAEAELEAFELYKNIGYCEYGQSLIGSGNFEFPKVCPPCCDNPRFILTLTGHACYNCGEYDVYTED